MRFVFDPALLEVLLQQYRASPQYRTKLIALLGRLEFSDDASARASAIARSRAVLLETLSNEYGA